MKRIILLLLTMILFFSCLSSEPVYMSLKAPMMMEEFKEGNIARTALQDNGFILYDESDSVIWQADFSRRLPAAVRGSLKTAMEYSSGVQNRPDGPVRTLLLSDEAGFLAYLGDGIRPGLAPDLGMDLKPGASGSGSILLKSGEGEWSVSVGAPADILIGGIPCRAYLLNAAEGQHMDQPPLTVDLLIIRQ